jgi:membrane protein DedA with SNARE-associated domain
MTDIIQYIQSNIEYAPILIFSLLLLAGFIIPIPEDGMLFISGTLAAKNPHFLLELFLAVYLGAYFSDLICYSLGRFLGPKILHMKFFARMVRQNQIDKIHDYYQRYGMLTLILGRFIPFGVRNGLFLTARLGKMNAAKFAVADLLACTVSTVTFFTLYYQFGSTMINYIKEFNIVVFIFGISIFGYLYLRKSRTGS